MRSIVPLLLLVLLASCSSARYATGPDSERIRAMEGFRGRIEAVEYPTAEKNLSRRRMVVYLPASYATDSLRRYPVLYLLHGARGNELTWQERGQVFSCLDSLVSVGEAAEFILVLPNLNNFFGDKDYKNGHASNATRAFWTLDGEAESHFVDEVVALTDSLFRTLPGKADRALAIGQSSGKVRVGGLVFPLFLSHGRILGASGFLRGPVEETGGPVRGPACGGLCNLYRPA